MHLPGCILDTPGYMVTYAMWVHLLVEILTDGEFSHFASLILLCRFYINLSGYILIDTSTWIYIWYIHLDIWLHIHLSGYNLLLYRCYINLPGYIFIDTSTWIYIWYDIRLYTSMWVYTCCFLLVASSHTTWLLTTT